MDFAGTSDWYVFLYLISLKYSLKDGGSVDDYDIPELIHLVPHADRCPGCVASFCVCCAL